MLLSDLHGLVRLWHKRLSRPRRVLFRSLRTGINNDGKEERSSAVELALGLHSRKQMEEWEI